MDTNTLDIVASRSLRPHRLTVADYFRMHETGIIPADARVELIEGQVFDMSPIGPRHQLVVDCLNALFCAGVDPATTIVRVQGPVLANNSSMPQPDLSILPRRWTGYPEQHPPAREAFLLIEVADSTLPADSTIKAGLYARSGVREYWIVDLNAGEVVVHREPADGSYAAIARRRGEERLEVAALPAIGMTVASIFQQQ